MILNPKYLTLSFSILLLFISFHSYADEKRSILPKTYSANNSDLPFAPNTKSTITSYLFITGNMAYINGTIPKHTADGVNDIEEQTQIVMSNLEKVLSTAGYGFQDTLKVSVKLSNIKNYDAFHSVYQHYWNKIGAEPVKEILQIGSLDSDQDGTPVLLEVSLFVGK